MVGLVLVGRPGVCRGVVQRRHSVVVPGLDHAVDLILQILEGRVGHALIARHFGADSFNGKGDAVGLLIDEGDIPLSGGHAAGKPSR